jgi:preprotein translocase subunit SecG
MSWLIGILTGFLVVDCLLLGLLVLIQLPKKEAGMGTAFGGGATDALFGAGTGNALTKMTKYATVVFFVLTMTLSMLRAHHSKTKRESFGKAIANAVAPAPPLPAGATNSAAGAATNAAPAAATNTPATPAANTPPPAATPAAPPASTEQPTTPPKGDAPAATTPPPATAPDAPPKN